MLNNTLLLCSLQKQSYTYMSVRYTMGEEVMVNHPSLGSTRGLAVYTKIKQDNPYSEALSVSGIDIEEHPERSVLVTPSN